MYSDLIVPNELPAMNLALENAEQGNIEAPEATHIRLRFPRIPGATLLELDKAEWILIVIQAALSEIDDITDLMLEHDFDEETFCKAYSNPEKQTRMDMKAICMATNNLVQATSRLEETWTNDLNLGYRFENISHVLRHGSLFRRVGDSLASGVGLPGPWRHKEWGECDEYDAKSHFNVIDQDVPSLQKDLVDLEELLHCCSPKALEDDVAAESWSRITATALGSWDVRNPEMDGNPEDVERAVSENDTAEDFTYEELVCSECSDLGADGTATPDSASESSSDTPQWVFTTQDPEGLDLDNAVSSATCSEVDLSKLEYVQAEYIIKNGRYAMRWLNEMKATIEQHNLDEAMFRDAHWNKNADLRRSAQVLVMQTISLSETLTKLVEPTHGGKVNLAERFKAVLDIEFIKSLRHVRNGCAHSYGVCETFKYDNCTPTHEAYDTGRHWRFINHILSEVLPGLEEMVESIEEVIPTLEKPIVEDMAELVKV